MTTHAMSQKEYIWLVDDASPSESPVYFRSLKGAVDWAENDDQYISYQGEEQWSVYRVGGKVL